MRLVQPFLVRRYALSSRGKCIMFDPNVFHLSAIWTVILQEGHVEMLADTRSMLTFKRNNNKVSQMLSM
jgi:hypothetical protein